MGEEASGGGGGGGWRCATNWRVGHGSLQNCVCFESLVTSANCSSSEDEDDGNSNNNVLLLLKPPPPHPCSSSPCEINFVFEKSHEIRQVYVRSTARIYEIYYAVGPQSENEYLCTVRCGIAAAVDPTFDANSSKEVISAKMEISTSVNEHLEDKGRNEGNNGTDEDGWVQVKASDSPLLDDGICSFAKMIHTNTETGVQDFYEATAEITDANPCVSLIIRLLSLQTKDNILVEEIYIFGEPASSEQKLSLPENSAGSSLMTMLVPTLLQLSKTGSKGDSSHVRCRLKNEEAESNATDSFPVPKNEEMNVKKANTGNSSGDQDPLSGRPEFGSTENDASYNRMESILDQLICRVGRIETFCLRFEENMLKPLENIETRLGRLEQQLEVLTSNSQSPKLYADTKVTAPELSCNNSETLNNVGNEDDHFASGSQCPSKDTTYIRSEFPCDDSERSSDENNCGGLESSQDTFYFIESLPANDDASDSVVPRLHPSLIVTAPEFLDDDEECSGGGVYCNDEIKFADGGSPVVKQSSSLDDALASALAGIMSSASFLPPKVDQTPIVKDLNSSDADDTGYPMVSPPAIKPCDGPITSSFFLGEHNGAENVRTLDSIFSLCFEDNEMQLMGLEIDASPGEVGETVVRPDLLQEVQADCSRVDNCVNQTITRNSDFDISGEEDISSGYGTVNQHYKEWTQESNLDLTSKNSLNHELSVAGTEDRTPSKPLKSIHAKLEFAGTDNTTAVGNDKNALVAVLSNTYNSSVDFDLPILDVKFVSHAQLKTTCSIEYLLSDMAETNIEDPFGDDNDDSVASGEQSQPSVEVTRSNISILDDNGLEVDDAMDKTDFPDMGRSKQIKDHFKSNDKG